MSAAGERLRVISNHLNTSQTMKYFPEMPRPKPVFKKVKRKPPNRWKTASSASTHPANSAPPENTSPLAPNISDNSTLPSTDEKAQKTASVVPITSHVLDTSTGQPAAGLRVSLFKKNPEGDGWLLLNKGTTNSDGRLPGLTSPGSFSPGVHMMRFETGEYYSAKKTFYPYVEVVFNIEDNEHYHVPLLLSPYGYSTYRGS